MTTWPSCTLQLILYKHFFCPETKTSHFITDVLNHEDLAFFWNILRLLCRLVIFSSQLYSNVLSQVNADQGHEQAGFRLQINGMSKMEFSDLSYSLPYWRNARRETLKDSIPVKAITLSNPVKIVFLKQLFCILLKKISNGFILRKIQALNNLVPPLSILACLEATPFSAVSLWS